MAPTKKRATSKPRAATKKKKDSTITSSTAATTTRRYSVVLDSPSTTLKKSAWMEPTIRTWLISLRPWSFPASLGPVAVAGALLHRPLSNVTYAPFQDNHGPDNSAVIAPVDNLFCLAYVCCFIVVLSFHASANLFNTYYDYINGNDTKQSADDRALVDSTILPSTVFYSAVGMLVTGGLAATWLTFSCPALLYVVVLPAMLLCFLYTANPCSLKRYALGDLTIFLMFGPLLMVGVSVAVTSSMGTMSSMSSFVLRKDILLYSIPIGLCTVSILHANNARDIKDDQAAGLTTLAMKLGRRGSYLFHCLLQTLVYGLIVLYVFTPIVSASISIPNPSLDLDPSLDPPLDLVNLLLPSLPLTYTTIRQLIVLCNVPWCLYNTKSFSSYRFYELPQKIAQHNLLFTTLLVMSLSEPLFLSRVLLTCLFYLGGVNNIIMWSYNVHLVHMKLNNIFSSGGTQSKNKKNTFVAVPFVVSKILFACASVFQLVVSLLFMCNVEPRLMCQLLLCWIVPITFVVHDMWTIEHDHPAHTIPLSVTFKEPAWGKRNVANFPTEFDNEFVHFFKNVGMIGGLVLYLEMGC